MIARLVAIGVAAASAAVLSISLLAMAGADGVADRSEIGFGGAPLPEPAPVPARQDAPPPTASAGVPEAASPAPVERRADPGVPVHSGRLEDVAVSAVMPPTGVRIGDLAVDAEVVPVGYVAETDEMEVPRSASLVGWYEFSASPGSAGSAVLAAHVDWNGRAGAFFDLHTLEEGTTIVVDYADGSSQRFEVFAAEQYDKHVLPTAAIFARDGEPLLTLVTCGGLFDEADQTYRDNVVVYARPAADPAVAPPT